MITDFLLSIPISIFNWMLAFIPSVPDMPSGLSHFLYYLGIALNFFPSDLFFILIGTVLFWGTANMIWAIVQLIASLLGHPLL